MHPVAVRAQLGLHWQPIFNGRLSTPISERAQEALLSSESIIVFLDVSLATAAPRVGFNRDRPLLLGNPRAQWQSLSEQRRPIYEKLATQSIKVDDMTVDEIVSIIESVLS